MKPILFTFLLCTACSTTATTYPVSLTIVNDTGRRERLHVTIEDISRRSKVFDRTSLLLPHGAEELGTVAEVESATNLRVCTTLLAYATGDEHMCRVFIVLGRPLHCMASAFERQDTHPYASVSCWDASGSRSTP